MSQQMQWKCSSCGTQCQGSPAKTVVPTASAATWSSGAQLLRFCRMCASGVEVQQGGATKRPAVEPQSSEGS